MRTSCVFPLMVVQLICNWSIDASIMGHCWAAKCTRIIYLERLTHIPFYIHSDECCVHKIQWLLKI